jgi:hypothetical protein
MGGNPVPAGLERLQTRCACLGQCFVDEADCLDLSLRRPEATMSENLKNTFAKGQAESRLLRQLPCQLSLVTFHIIFWVGLESSVAGDRYVCDKELERVMSFRLA